MSNIKFKKVNQQAFSNLEIKALGHSILDGIAGKIEDAVTHQLPEMKLYGNYDSKAINACTTSIFITSHIDIFAKSANITYDAGAEYPVDKAVILGYYHTISQDNYSLGEFKLYASSDLDTLFDDCNEVAHEIGRDHWYFGDKNNSDWVYDVEGTFRYFGVKILDSNPTDDIARLGFIGLYNEEYTHNVEYLHNNFPVNILSRQEPAILTDGCIFSEYAKLNINGTESYTFTLEDYADITDVWVIGANGLTVKVSGFENCDVKPLEKGRVAYYFNAQSVPLNNGKLTVTVSGNGYIEQIGAFSANRKMKVDFDNVICDDFMGIGADVLPMSFMPESIETGYNEVYWALESERIKKAKPNVVRMWFQPDWLCDTYEQYKNEEYDFENQKLQSVIRYLELFKEIGTEVEFNFGWKVSSHAIEWYSLDIQNKRNSAPREIDLFAKCCAKTLQEFITNRGFDNIKYLTFYNEPDYGNYTEHGDFVVGDGIDRRPYWEKMMRETYKEMQKVGLVHIQLWGCEQSGSTEKQVEWITYMEENCRDILSMHTDHRYKVDYNSAIDYFSRLTAAAKGMPVFLTECGQNYGNIDFRWEMNEVQLFNNVANCGISGALIWCLNGMSITDPCSFTMNNEIDFWGCPQLDGGIDNVRENYYRWAMLSHYIPNHSKSVVSSVISGNGDNTRICAFTNGDDYTIVVELNNDILKNRNIEIDLGKHVGKKFYKHVYKMPQLRDGNATLPPVSAEIFADDTLCDTVNSDYQEVVYTTIPPVVQVALPQNEVFLKEGQKYLLSGTVIDGNGDIDFQLCATVGDGEVFDGINRTVRFNENAKAGDMFAIKATAKNTPTATSVVIFKYIG